MKIAIILTFLGLILGVGYACSDVGFDKKSGTGGKLGGTDLTPGEPIDPGEFPECDNIVIAEAPVACLVFEDSFERSNIVDHDDFRWDVVIMDNGKSGSNVDAQIEDDGHLGHVIDENKAIIFRGREGGSTHEIYLVSSAFDLSQFDKVFIQFKYIPIELESSITLTHSGEELPESIRIDICKESDHDCGLSGSNRHERIRNNFQWDQIWFEPLQFGQNLNIRNYGANDWKLAQVLIDLSDYADRKDKFVFKITAAMDEGYKANDRNRSMEDGIILDHVIMIVAKD